MAFCANCGTQMEDGVKFCPSCGTAAGGTAPAKVKAGNIVKCPSCGASVPSMTAVCPDCGHEFRNVSAGGKIKEFFDTVVALESGGNSGRKKLEAYVLGYPVPNTKEDIVEFIMFCSARAEAEKAGSYNSWGNKCVQAYRRAELVMASDKESLGKLAEILWEKDILVGKKDIKAVKAKKRILAAIPAAIIIFLVGYIHTCYTGTFITVPGPKSFSAADVSFSGKYFKIAGDTVNVTPNPVEGGDGGVTITFRLECIESPAPDISKKYEQFLEEKGWKNDTCSFTLYDASIETGKYSTSHVGGLGQISLVRSMLDMKKGDAGDFTMIFDDFLDYPGAAKKAISAFMANSSLSFSLHITYRVTNETWKEKNKSGSVEFFYPN